MKEQHPFREYILKKLREVKCKPIAYIGDTVIDPESRYIIGFHVHDETLTYVVKDLDTGFLIETGRIIDPVINRSKNSHVSRIQKRYNNATAISEI